VCMEVFDVKGRRVAVLVDELRAAGSYVITWRAVDDEGMDLPSGIYFCTMQVGENLEIRKMVLLQ
jgi:hypothetical protein